LKSLLAEDWEQVRAQAAVTRWGEMVAFMWRFGFKERMNG
jgi:hypothetical protein